MKHPPFADRSLLGTCMQVAYGMTLRPAQLQPTTPGAWSRSSASFFEALPANARARAPVAPAVLASKRAPRRNPLQRALDAVDKWFYRQQVAARERYLAQAQDVFEVEARMRELERRPYY
jgi:hypothetical protein